MTHLGGGLFTILHSFLGNIKGSGINLDYGTYIHTYIRGVKVILTIIPNIMITF